jgi:hypothetical protein
MKIIITEGQYIYTQKYELLRNMIDREFGPMFFWSSFCDHESDNIIDHMIYTAREELLDDFHNTVDKPRRDYDTEVNNMTSFIKQNLSKYIVSKFNGLKDIKNC